MKIIGWAAVGLLIGLGSASSQARMPMNASNPYITIKSVTACYYAAESTDNSTAYFPTIIVKFTPKTYLDFVQISGTFVNVSNGEAIGNRAREVGLGLEAGVTYTFKVYPGVGWAVLADRKTLIKPILSLNKISKGISGREYVMATVTKFPAKECP